MPDEPAPQSMSAKPPLEVMAGEATAGALLHSGGPAFFGGDFPFPEWLGKVVVLDTQGPLLYIGTLVAILTHTYELGDADVHDANDSRSSKELYLMETRDLGVRVNRGRVLVVRSAVVSLSLLEDICH